MSVLPNFKGKNLGQIMTLLDERLSELYSIHGKATPRGDSLTVTGSIESASSDPIRMDRANKGITLGTNPLFGPTANATVSFNGFRPTPGTLYRQRIPIAWGVWSQFNRLISAFNLTATTITTATAVRYKIVQPYYITPGNAVSLCPVASLIGGGGAVGNRSSGIHCAQNSDNGTFNVYTYMIDLNIPLTYNSLMSHNVVVFGYH